MGQYGRVQHMIRSWVTRLLALVLFVAVAGCAVPETTGQGASGAGRTAAATGTDGLPSPEVAADNFVEVVDRVGPVADAVCRRHKVAHCHFGIYVASDSRLPPNAFQTVDPAGDPAIIVTISMIAFAHNSDELAFILGHEAAHHILGHIAASEAEARRAAATLGDAVAEQGGDRRAVAQAQMVGAALGARRYSKQHELDADALGARIALAAGFDPLVGAAYFARQPDPGNEFLGTHPPNAERLATVQRVVRGLKAGS